MYTTSMNARPGDPDARRLAAELSAIYAHEGAASPQRRSVLRRLGAWLQHS